MLNDTLFLEKKKENNGKSRRNGCLRHVTSHIVYYVSVSVNVLIQINGTGNIMIYISLTSGYKVYRQELYKTV